MGAGGLGIDTARAVRAWGATCAALFLLLLPGDPVVVTVAVASAQVLLFPAVRWLVYLLAAVAVGSMYAAHDVGLSDEKTAAIRVDRALQRTLSWPLVLLAIWFVLMGVRDFFLRKGARLRALLRALGRAAAPALVLALKGTVDTFGDASVFDSAAAVLRYAGEHMRWWGRWLGVVAEVFGLRSPSA